MKQNMNTNYDGISMEKLYADGRYIATVYYDDYNYTYRVFNDERYDYYEGRNYDDEF